MPSVNSIIVDTFNNEQFKVEDSSEYALKVKSLSTGESCFITSDLYDARFKKVPNNKETK